MALICSRLAVNLLVIVTLPNVGSVNEAALLLWHTKLCASVNVVTVAALVNALTVVCHVPSVNLEALGKFAVFLALRNARL